MLSTQPWVGSGHPGVLNGAISELSHKWHPQTGPSPSDGPRQLPQPILALCPTPKLRLALGPAHAMAQRWEGSAGAPGRPGPPPGALPPPCVGRLFLVLDTDQLGMIQGTGRHPKA